jgi:hypothetical protein
MARDCTLFKDDDGSAFFIFASDDNANLVISRLTDDYLDPDVAFTRVFPGRYMEAPCVFKRNGIYYLIASDCTGWHPNEARSAYAGSIWGNWREIGNPCLGPNAEICFGAQSTFVFPLQGMPGKFVFMADQWRPENLADSRYVWLPIEFRPVPGYSVERPFVSWSESCSVA